MPDHSLWRHKGKKIIQARGWFGGWKCFLHRRGWKAELVPWNQCKKPMWRCPSVISAIPQRARRTGPAIGSRAETTISACLRLSALRKWERINPPNCLLTSTCSKAHTHTHTYTPITHTYISYNTHPCTRSLMYTCTSYNTIPYTHTNKYTNSNNSNKRNSKKQTSESKIEELRFGFMTRESHSAVSQLSGIIV